MTNLTPLDRRSDDIRIANIEKSVAVIEKGMEYMTETLRDMKNNQRELEIMIRDELKNQQEQINKIKEEQITIKTVIKISSAIGVAIGTAILALSKYAIAALGMVAR